MKKKYSITGMDCANCAAKLEVKMNSLPEVNNVVLTFATGQLLVDADDLDKALEVLRELAEKEEPGTIIKDLKRPGSIGNNTADVAHIHKHTDGHNHTHHHHHHGHEHHHHHHKEGEECCHHHHEDSEECCHHHDGEQHHHHEEGEECCCHHDSEHHHHHEEGEGCCCHHDGEHHHEHGHHHHHADEVFTSWGVETAYKFTEDELKNIINKLSTGNTYGEVLRAKGIVASTEGEWFHFDLVPEETELRRGAADFTGRICVIGSKLDEKAIKELFHVA